MKRTVLILCALLLPMAIWAEPIQVTFTEYDAVAGGQSGQLQKSCIWLYGRANTTNLGCATVPLRLATCVNSDDGNGGDTFTDFAAGNWPIQQGQEPVTVCVCVNSYLTNGNSTNPNATCVSPPVCFGATCPP